jgi:hypothetical protein
VLERLFDKEKIHPFLEITKLMQSALTKCKREKNRKYETNFFMVNALFDEECKTTKKNLKESSQK